MNSKDIVRAIASKIPLSLSANVLKDDVQRIINNVAKADDRDLVRHLNSVKGSRPKDGQPDVLLADRRIAVLDEFAEKWRRAGAELATLLPEVNLATYYVERRVAHTRNLAQYWQAVSSLSWVREYVPFAFRKEESEAEVKAEAEPINEEA